MSSVLLPSRWSARQAQCGSQNNTSLSHTVPVVQITLRTTLLQNYCNLLISKEIQQQCMTLYTSSIYSLVVTGLEDFPLSDSPTTVLFFWCNPFMQFHSILLALHREQVTKTFWSISVPKLHGPEFFSHPFTIPIPFLFKIYLEREAFSLCNCSFYKESQQLHLACKLEAFTQWTDSKDLQGFFNCEVFSFPPFHSKNFKVFFSWEL